MSGVVAMALILGACGGGSSSSNSSATTSSAAAKHFLGKEGEEQLAGYQTEGTDLELQEAASAVAASLKARATHDWAGQCATLSTTSSKKVVGKSHKSCAVALGEQGEKAPPSVLEDNMKGDVVALRIKGDKGYALFLGTDKHKWAMPMEKDGGEWKVSALVATALPSS